MIYLLSGRNALRCDLTNYGRINFFALFEIYTEVEPHPAHSVGTRSFIYW